MVLLLVLAVVLAWPAWLVFDTNSRLGREDALVAGPDTPGTTYLLAGSDERAADSGSAVEGRRADSIIMIHKAPNGQTSMISLPRDTYVEIPGYGYNKLNASYSFGGPQLLVETVQNLSGLTVDHYAQVNMEGFGALVDAVNGVELCLDMDVDDPKSNLTWESGCHQADGETALAFARMRYQDPRGDIGRAERQRQVIEAVAKNALSPQMLINPFQQQRLAKSGAAALTVDESASVIDIARMLLAFRGAGKSGLSGTPPIATVSEQTEVGSVVLLDDDRAPDFFDRLARGELVKSDFDSDL